MRRDSKKSRTHIKNRNEYFPYYIYYLYRFNKKNKLHNHT